MHGRGARSANAAAAGGDAAASILNASSALARHGPKRVTLALAAKADALAGSRGSTRTDGG